METWINVRDSTSVELALSKLTAAVFRAVWKGSNVFYATLATNFCIMNQWHHSAQSFLICSTETRNSTDSMLWNFLYNEDISPVPWGPLLPVPYPGGGENRGAIAPPEICVHNREASKEESSNRDGMHWVVITNAKSLYSSLTSELIVMGTEYQKKRSSSDGHSQQILGHLTGAASRKSLGQASDFATYPAMLTIWFLEVLTEQTRKKSKAARRLNFFFKIL